MGAREAEKWRIIVCSGAEGAKKNEAFGTLIKSIKCYFLASDLR